MNAAPQNPRRTATNSWPSATAFSACVFYLYTIGSLLVWALLPTVFGLTPTVLVSDSMAPQLRAGDIVVTSRADRAAKVGNVITFADPGRPGRLLTHRVTAVTEGGSYRTRGDANARADSTLVAPESVVGLGRLAVPAVGLPLVWARSGHWLGLLAWLTASAAAITYARRFSVPLRPSTWTLPAAGTPPRAAPATPAAATAPRSGTWQLPSRRRLRISRPAYAATAAVVVVALVAAVGLTPRMSWAAFVAVNDNAGNALQATTLQPPTGLTVTPECTQSPAVTFLANTTSEGQTTAQTLSTPAGVEAGDLLIAQIVTRDNVVPVTPAGWTALRSDGGGPKSSLYYRVAEAGEPATARWTTGGNVRWVGAMGAWSGASTTTPISASSGTGGSFSAPSVTTTRPNQTLVAFFGQMHDGGFSPPSGMTERWDRATNAGGSSSHQVGAAAADELFAGVGATGVRTASGAGGGAIAQMVALNRPVDSFRGLVQWTPTSSTWATGHTLVRRYGGVDQASYTVTPRTTASRLDSGLGPSRTYTYHLNAYYGSWVSSVVSTDFTTAAYCP